MAEFIDNHRHRKLMKLARGKKKNHFTINMTKKRVTSRPVTISTKPRNLREQSWLLCCNRNNVQQVGLCCVATKQLPEVRSMPSIFVIPLEASGDLRL